VTDSPDIPRSEVSPGAQLRCPKGNRLFAIRKVSPIDPEDNLIEIACPDCSRDTRRLKGLSVRVLHCYDILGTYIETREVMRANSVVCNDVSSMWRTEE